MTTEIMQAKMELKELVDTFSNLADVKDAASQGELFLPDGILEFQIGPDGEISSIVGREALVEAFYNTINPCKAVYHINGQHNVTVNESCTAAEGTAYCQATLVNDEDGKDIITTNYVRYADLYEKADGKWYIKRRRTTFLIMDKRELGK
ncbi:nuclear transport factor 2 family protein [bacterium D16-76]|nr:nuclear transport factor 2 family protein [bacterium D16-76]